MQPRISRLVVVAVALCAAAAAAVASANPAASTQRFTLTAKTVHGKDGPTRVTAAGPIRGVGSVQIKSSPDTRVDHMTLQLAKGRGHGTYQRRGILIGARSAHGSCLGRKAAPTASSITVVMTGTAALGSA
jgi:hypothetical protein